MSARKGFKATAHVVQAVHAVMVRPNGQGQPEVLLGRRANTSYGDGLYSFPAGHVEPFEPIAEALARELREETGVAPAFNRLKQAPDLVIEHLKDYGPAAVSGQRFRPYVEYFFKVPRWRGEIYNAEPGKCTDLRFFPVARLPADMLPLARHALAHLNATNDRFSRFGWDNPDFLAWKKSNVLAPA